MTADPTPNGEIALPIKQWARSETRARILDAGLRAFVHLGYGGATISKIAEAAGMSKTRVIYHFENPDAVLKELAIIWGELGRTVTVDHLASLTSESLDDRIVAMSSAMYRWMKLYPDFARLTPILFHAANHNPKIAELQKATFDKGKARLLEFLSNRSGSRLSPDQLREMALAIHLLMIGGSLYLISVNGWDDLERLQSLTESAIRALLGSRA